MNPLLVARSLREEYLLLKTAFHPRQDDVREAFDAEVERDGFLTREPFIALAQPYQFGSALTELQPLTRERFGPICQTPYHHQAEACRRILSGQATVVATGTGSGKTETFLMPIVDHCLRMHQTGKNSVKAILIYPMNALANDQCSRIRRLLEGTDISFGRYTRETKMWGSRPSDAPPNGCGSRGRKSPSWMSWRPGRSASVSSGIPCGGRSRQRCWPVPACPTTTW